MVNITDFTAHRAAQAALYAQSSASIIKQLPDAADSLSASLAHLARDPTPDGAERMAAKLNGLATTCLRLRAALLRESLEVPPDAA